jgi:hypothetical protein
VVEVRLRGIVFRLLEQAVVDEHGEEMWDTLLDVAEVSGAYTSLGVYDDSELMALVGAASSAFGMDAPGVLRWLGRAALPMLARSYPDFFTPHTSAKAFVASLNDIIHPEVRKLHPGADVPDFETEDRGAEGLVLGYASPRRLCAFAEGLVEGAAAFYGEVVTISQTACMHRGDARCLLRVVFIPNGP